MILLERWIIAVILSVGLVSTVGSAPGQSSSAEREAGQVEAAKPSLATADQAQPDPGSGQDQAQPEEPAADQAASDPATPEEPAADQAAADQTKPEEPAADQAAADQTKPEEPAADQSAADQAKPEEPAADQTASEPAKPEEPAKPDPPANQPAAKQVVATPHGSPEEQQLQKETTRLLQLVEELKAEVAKAGSNTLSLTAVRKADEVLKLSKDLKERMKERGLVPQSRVQ
jgi:hypothetical protein